MFLLHTKLSTLLCLSVFVSIVTANALVSESSTGADAVKPNVSKELGVAGESTEEMPVHDSPFAGIRVGEALDPPLCPPPPLTRSLGICFLQKCSSNQECSRSSACCFNGCIHTCMEPMDRPAAFDWIEDTSKILPILGAEFEEPSQPFFPIPLQKHPPEFEAAVGGEELVHLPGGCFISASKYEKLKEFMKTPSIKECRCDDGEVVCDIRTRDAQ